MIRSMLTALIAFTVAVPLSAASAQTVDQAGADTLANLIKRYLGTTLLPPNDLVSYRMTGPIQVMPAGDRYEADLPGLVLEIAPDMELSVEPTSLSIVEDANGWYTSTWDMVWPISLYNPDGTERVDLSARQQVNSVTASPVWGFPIDQTIDWQDFSIDLQEAGGAVPPIDFGLGRLFFNVDSTERSDGFFDQTSTFGLSNLLVDAREFEQAFLSLDAAEFGGTMTGADFDLWGELATVAALPEVQSGVDLGPIVDFISSNTDRPWFDALNAGYTISGIDIVSPEGSGSLNLAGLEIGISGLASPAMAFSTYLEVAGFDSPDVPAEFKPAIPNTVIVDVSIVDLPTELIPETVTNVIASMGRMDPESAFQDAALTLGLMAMSSDVALEINELLIDGELGYITGTGKVEPDPSSAFGAVGQVTLRVAGLDDMLAYAGTLGPEAQMVTVAGAVVSAMGQQGTDANGVDIKTYNLELMPDGQMLLNGTDLSSIMGSVQ